MRPSAADNRDSFAVHRPSRYLCVMQGRIIIGAIAFSALLPTAAIAGEPARRQPCPKVEQPQQRQQSPQPRVRTQECRTQKAIPWVVDPTPIFFL